MGIDCGSQVVICDVPVRFDTYKVVHTIVNIASQEKTEIYQK